MAAPTQTASNSSLFSEGVVASVEDRPKLGRMVNIKTCLKHTSLNTRSIIRKHVLKMNFFLWLPVAFIAKFTTILSIENIKHSVLIASHT